MPGHLGSVLRRARAAAGWSRANVEQRAKLPPRSLERWEARGQRPDDGTLLRLAAVLGLPPAALGLRVGADEVVAAVGLAEVLDGLVAAHGPEQVAVEALKAAFRGKV